MPHSVARVLGTGSHAVICLNGWFGHSGNWGSWEQLLDTDTFSWVFPDYRGYGRRIDEVGEFTIEEISDDLLSVLDDLKDQESVSILGHSMGGVFGQHLLSKADGRIASFIGVSPVPASGSPMSSEQRQLFESAETEVGSRRTIIDITTGQRLSGRWLDEMAETSRKMSTDTAVGRCFHAWADCGFLEDLGKQQIPALVVVGAQDPAVTVDSVKGTYGRTFSDLTVLEFSDAGHYAMHEAPVRLVTEVENFLQSQVVTA